MKIDNYKLDLALARKRKSLHEMRGNGLSPQTLSRIQRGDDVKPKIIGTLAQALGVDPAEIIQERS